jgi:uncharacterized protein YoaH (UPF0181 family)
VDKRALLLTLGSTQDQNLVAGSAVAILIRGVEPIFELMANPQSKSEIARDILAYLISNPEAQDTFAGIVEWWLLEEQIKRRSESIREALAELVSSGLIIEIVGKDSQTNYRINGERAAEITTLLDRERVGLQQERNRSHESS